MLTLHFSLRRINIEVSFPEQSSVMLVLVKAVRVL